MSSAALAKAEPKPWRVVVGFVVAPLVATITWGFAGFVSGAPFASLVIFVKFVTTFAYLQTAVFGVPAYLLLRRRARPGLSIILLVGGLVAAAPWAIAMLTLPNAATQATIGTCRTIVDGRTTWCGYWEDAKFWGLLFGLGCVGGAAFWVSVVYRDPSLSKQDMNQVPYTS